MRQIQNRRANGLLLFPFIFLGVGVVAGISPLSRVISKYSDDVLNVSLIVLLLAIGAGIGLNDSVVSSIGLIGLRCAVISLSAIAFSILFTLILEKTVLPLDAMRVKLLESKISVTGTPAASGSPSDEGGKFSPLVWAMPGSIIAGVVTGYFFIPESWGSALDILLSLSLAILYTSVGISAAQNREVIAYIKMLGWKVLLLCVSITAGSLAGGLFAALITGTPMHIAVISAGGMCYYSVTGAYLTRAFGIETGAYGFLVNIMREFFTVVLIPFFMRISKGSPIAAGAAGDMDTMLVPITRFLGGELGMVALIIGTVLTFAIPVLLPVLGGLLGAIV